MAAYFIFQRLNVGICAPKYIRAYYSKNMKSDVCKNVLGFNIVKKIFVWLCSQ